ncbi:MAG: magnesium transporter [Bacteroidia bacterium]|nr:magnesium transporter [Bacteroidia bacterium]
MSNFTVTKELISELRQAVEARNGQEVKKLLHELHPEDVAEILYDFGTEDSKFVIALFEGEYAVKILIEIDEDTRDRFLTNYSPEEIARQFIEFMDTDDVVSIIRSFPPKLKDQIISHITDHEFAANIISLLNFDEDTAGGIMAKELVKVNENWTVAQCIDEIRAQAEEVSNVYTVYVVDDQDRLKGLISLKRLILAKARERVAAIMIEDVVSVPTHASSEEVSSIMDKYNLVVLPVSDAIGRLVGRITIDDIVEVIKEEAEKDYELMSGITESVESTDKVWVLSRARLPWLLIGLLGGIVSSRVIGLYEGQLKIHPEMAFFIPLIAAMGGNAGVQSSAIIVKGLANNTLGTRDIFPKILKELMVSLINGLVCAAIILAYNLFMSDSLELSFTVSIALITVIIFASILGTFVPMLLDRVKIDPALATGPFITTTNDLLGLGVYFLVGRLLYGTF